MMNAIFICKVIILTLGSICFFGCSGDEKNIPRNLINYRILAVVAEPPQVMLSDLIAGNSPTVRVRAVDFEPNDLDGLKEREYEWTLCFSVGAVTQFACLDDAYSITQKSSIPTFEFTPDLETLIQLLPPEFLEQVQMMTMELETPRLDSSSPCGDSAGQACTVSSSCAAGFTCEDGYCAPPPN